MSDLPQPPAAAPRIALGAMLPDLNALPTLDQGLPVGGSQRSHSHLAAGTHFEGRVQFAGALTVAGELAGRVEAAPAADTAHLTIAETGRLQGEVHVRSISVQGHAQGVLSAPGGRVALHATAVVTGQVRYGQLQVNGADLNARVERATLPPEPPALPAHGPQAR